MKIIDINMVTLRAASGKSNHNLKYTIPYSNGERIRRPITVRQYSRPNPRPSQPKSRRRLRDRCEPVGHAYEALTLFPRALAAQLRLGKQETIIHTNNSSSRSSRPHCGWRLLLLCAGEVQEVYNQTQQNVMITVEVVLTHIKQ